MSTHVEMNEYSRGDVLVAPPHHLELLLEGAWFQVGTLCDEPGRETTGREDQRQRVRGPCRRLMPGSPSGFACGTLEFSGMSKGDGLPAHELLTTTVLGFAEVQLSATHWDHVHCKG